MLGEQHRCHVTERNQETLAVARPCPLHLVFVGSTERTRTRSRLVAIETPELPGTRKTFRTSKGTRTRAKRTRGSGTMSLGAGKGGPKEPR